MGRLILIACFSIFSITANAQFPDTSLNQKPLAFLQGNFSNFFVDNFQNIYLINLINQIKKIDQQFDSMAVYNDSRNYGDIASIDVNNPLKIAVFYKDFATIVVLDRYLSFRNKIDLRNAGITDPIAFTQSFDNNYWIFDAVDNTIKKIDNNGRVIQYFNDIRLLFSFNFIPKKIIDQNNLLYLYDPEYGWLIFDYNGALKQKFPFKGLTDIQVVNGKPTGRSGNKFYILNTNDFSVTTIDIPKSDFPIIKCSVNNNFYYLLNQKGLFLYPITK